MARSADSGFWMDEFVHSTVAKASIIRVTVVTSKTTFVGYESAEIIMLMTPVVEVVHESFKVVDIPNVDPRKNSTFLLAKIT
jgi:hypothetical protein